MVTEAKVGGLLRKKGLKLAVAESCTGGLIAKRITDVAGASDYFDLGMVSYSNKVKERFLGVPENVLCEKGAVSPEVALAMATGVRKAALSDIGLSVTGIAGPGGGTAEKPVGTVYIGLSWSDRVLVRKHLFHGDRSAIREETSEEALKLVLNCLEGKLE